MFTFILIISKDLFTFMVIKERRMKSSELLRILKKDGWYEVRQGGTSHIIMAHPTKRGTFPFPYHGSKEVGKGLADKILKHAGLK
ncbi:MAG TPA: type II toxin-antitoxin system HicA family toxin [Mucilaginibacter sp.]|jgi:predicted RNA binding protein YcfA (HicA-like mRNA interferase family)